MWTSIAPAGDDESGRFPLPKSKRRKVEVACDTCRLRKTRCDGARPKCGACLRRKNVADVCVYAEQPSPLLFNPTPKASSRAPGQAGHTPEHSVRGKGEDKPVPNVHGVEGERNWILKAGLLAASNSASFFNTVFGESSGTGPETSDDLIDGSGPEIRDRQEAGDRLSFDRPAISQKRAHSADYVLPSRKVADTLIDSFLRHAYIQWVDRLKFMHWYESLWDGQEKTMLDAADEQVQFAHLNLIFALVYQSDTEDLAENQAQLAETYFLRAKRLLQLCLLDLDRIDLLWALLLLAQWFQSVNDVRACTSLVGLCILIARNLGLHKPERIDSLPSQYRREIARRAWHGCILMDRITAMISGQPLQIAQSLATKATLFTAIDDEYLTTGSSVDDGTLGVQAPGNPSNVSFFLAFCQLHLILGDVLDHQDEGKTVIDINHVIDIDNKLDTFRKGLPPHLHFDDRLVEASDKMGKSPLSGPLVHLRARFLHIRIILYRPFFLHRARRSKHPATTRTDLSLGSFAEAITHQGMLTCIRTAQQILDLIHARSLSDNPSARVAVQWWHIVTYVYTATTILIAAHIFSEVADEITTTSLADFIQKGFQILTYHTRYGESARRCKTALTVLCERYIKNRPSSRHSPRPVQQVPQSRATNTEIPSDMWSGSPEPPFDGGDLPAAAFVRDFTGSSSEFFRGEGIESLLFFNADNWGQEMNDWM
ncbi:hypothetical protein PV08_11808 [Exophiala spinifera]|uniref:Zn(2)-C6 fungal-type domain-containing protein n=1 Tax=Exophiala spinifera TaxID=91928 RepID=A0A0D1ZAL8_9EURO|nr:uncharacterized protein PV08_11808 [Exophiala spinifera]KIW10032.1 hypothetical protein PV08_11808 [Exophiala spinifera]